MLLSNQVLGLFLGRFYLLVDLCDCQMVFSVIRLFKRCLWFVRNDRVHGHIGAVASFAPCSELVFGKAWVELAPGYKWLILFRHRRTFLPELLLTIRDLWLLSTGLSTTTLIPLVSIGLNVLRIAIILGHLWLVSTSSLTAFSSARFTFVLLSTAIICCGSTSPASCRLHTLRFYILAVCLGSAIIIFSIASCLDSVNHLLLLGWFQGVFLLAIGLATPSVLSEALITLFLCRGSACI